MTKKSKKILTEISAGELLDKISILEIKLDKIKDKENLNDINKEYKSLSETKNTHLQITKDVQNLIDQLKDVNLKLWSIEDEKRMFEKNSDFSEKFIKVSRDIHFLNDERSKVKLEINSQTGSKIREIKKYTDY